MRTLLAVALLVPSLAHAELSNTETAGIGIGLGAVVATYAAVSTVFMLDQLLKEGWAEPKYSVPAAFLAAGSLVGSVAGVVIWGRAGDEIGIVGGAMAAMGSAVMCFFVALAMHGYSIHHPNITW